MLTHLIVKKWSLQHKHNPNLVCGTSCGNCVHPERVKRGQTTEMTPGKVKSLMRFDVRTGRLGDKRTLSIICCYKGIKQRQWKLLEWPTHDKWLLWMTDWDLYSQHDVHWTFQVQPRGRKWASCPLFWGRRFDIQKLKINMLLVCFSEINFCQGCHFKARWLLVSVEKFSIGTDADTDSED